MFRYRRGLLPVIVLAFGAITAACARDQGEEPASSQTSSAPVEEGGTAFEDITVEQLRQMLVDADPFLVNVHIPFEGDIPGTDQSIRFDEIAEHLDLLPEARDAQIVLYCRSGRMSTEAATTLASLGYTDVSNLNGGFRAWDAAGYAIEK
jgi:rhodanese-related sulfurtransferase